MTPAPSLPPLSAVATRDRLAGHLNHLTPEQAEALVEFKAMLAETEYYIPPTATTEASHDEPTLLRFLRARKFEVHGAYAQFTSAEDWRREERVGETYDDFPVDDFVFTTKVYPQWTGRRDRAGLPVYVFKISGLTKEAIAAYNADDTRLSSRMVALYEHMVQFVLPFCSSVPHSNQDTPISATTTIVDISHVSLGRFWALRSHMQRASILASKNYAETLGTIYIVGAPNFFSVVWGWIGKWFDPGTVEKIFILKSDEVLPTLTRFIAPENIPKQFGGDLDWSYGSGAGPSLDQPSQETLGLEELPIGSLRWIHGRLAVKGTGRSAEELVKLAKFEEERPGVVVPVEQPVEEAEKVEVNGKAAVANEEEEEEGEEEEDHTIWTTAREEPAAPVKELAATLEGTVL